MKLLLATITLLTIFASYVAGTKNNCRSAGHQIGNQTLQQDTTPRVTGIGGIFFYADSIRKTKAWYHQNLGLAMNDFGSVFEFRNANRPEETNYLIWSLHRRGSTYFSPTSKEFMINYRVQNLERLIDKLKSNGVTVLDTIESYDYGKFVHIMDPEGNKIELWEPVDSVLTKFGGNTTK